MAIVPSLRVISISYIKYQWHSSVEQIVSDLYQHKVEWLIIPLQVGYKLSLLFNL